MAYNPPSVTVTSIANNRIINISEDVRIPAVIGPGPMSRVITDYAITRGSLAYDLLPTSGSTVTLTRVAAYPGASSSNSEWDLGVHIDPSGSTGAVYWAGVQGVHQPLLGQTYYLSYKYPVFSTQFDPQLFTDTKDVIAFYGGEGTGIKVGPTTGSGSLAIGANLALENGAPAVICLQVSGSYSSATTWSEAFAKLEKKSNIGYLVPLASGSTGKTAAHNAAIAHVNLESAPSVGHEQSCILGASSGMAAETIVTNAETIADRRVIYMAPGKGITRTTAAGTVITLDGAWVGAAFAGLLASQEKLITPVTGKVLTGFVIPDDQYTPIILNRFGANGVNVVTALNGINKIRHSTTTDPTSADTWEVSIVAADDMVRRVTRNALTSTYVGKGIVIDDATTSAVEATVASIWGALRRQGLIQNYGTKTDPTTGEVPISAIRDSADPTKINIAGAIQLLYPLNFISVEFFVYV